jgi:hypothetical protein
VSGEFRVRAPSRPYTFRQGLLAARSHVVFLLALCTAFGAVVLLERFDLDGALRPTVRLQATPPLPPQRQRPLDERELAWARTAWTYFERNTRPETGLVDSVEGHAATTMWDTGSFLLAVVAAERLGLIPVEELERRLRAALASLARMPLFDGELPNKSYDTRTLAMTDYAGTPVERGIGWSAIDIGRLLVPFEIVLWSHPGLTPEVRAVVGRWRTERMIRDGLLWGARVDAAGRTELVQEGRLGYEEYAARALALLGADVTEALRYDDYLRLVEIEGVPVATDRRRPEDFDAFDYVVSEPYVLDGIELGWPGPTAEMSKRVYRAQERRHARTGIATAVSEDHVDRPPYFVYNTVFAAGRPWNTITDTGADASPLRSLSVKAALGWSVLYDTPYAAELRRQLAGLADPERGWYAGRYEEDGEINRALTANTNAIVLESLCYLRHGALLRRSFEDGRE